MRMLDARSTLQHNKENRNGPGSYRIDSCSSTGDFFTMGFCGYYPVGTILQTTLILTQTADMVSGTFFLGTLSSTATGQIATNGQLTLSGIYTSGTTSISVIYSLQQTTPGQITGGVGQIWTDTTMSGNGQYVGTIVSLPRTSPAPNEGAGTPLMMRNPTLQDLIRALGIR